MRAGCRLVSPGVASEKDSKEPEWEMVCVTYPLERNMLNPLDDNDLWKMTSEKLACFVSFHVRAWDLRNGKFDARRLFRDGI
jgi:hypothetical protein